MTIPSFRRSSAPKREIRQRDRKKERWRGSRHERGYDREWEKLRDAYFKEKKGLCEECRRRGYLEPGDVVDHIEPVRDAPDKRLDWNNCQVLCTIHHAWKYKVEEFALKTGQIGLLAQWMKHPETRPAQFQIVKKGPLKDFLDEDQGEDPAGSGE